MSETEEEWVTIVVAGDDVHLYPYQDERANVTHWMATGSMGYFECFSTRAAGWRDSLERNGPMPNARVHDYRQTEEG
jgi:hypothetical protein